MINADKLRGTEKQRKWAAKIKNDKIKLVKQVLFDISENCFNLCNKDERQEIIDDLGKTIQIMISIDSSNFWIQNRFKSAEDIITKVFGHQILHYRVERINRFDRR